MAGGDDANWGRYTSLGFEVAGSVGLGAFLGWLVDRWLHTTVAWGVIGGVLLGVAAGMYVLVKEALRMNRN